MPTVVFCYMTVWLQSPELNVCVTVQCLMAAVYQHVNNLMMLHDVIARSLLLLFVCCLGVYLPLITQYVINATEVSPSKLLCSATVLLYRMSPDTGSYELDWRTHTWIEDMMSLTGDQMKQTITTVKITDFPGLKMTGNSLDNIRKQVNNI